MSRFSKTTLAAALAIGLAARRRRPGRRQVQRRRPRGHPAEIHAWDIDVRPDFKGLRPGSGSVAQGEEVWEAKCASCHGSFGESNEVHTPLIGGTTKDDIKTGRVASLAKGDAPSAPRS
jgi:cytochrome c